MVEDEMRIYAIVLERAKKAREAKMKAAEPEPERVPLAVGDKIVLHSRMHAVWKMQEQDPENPHLLPVPDYDSEPLIGVGDTLVLEEVVDLYREPARLPQSQRAIFRNMRNDETIDYNLLSIESAVSTGRLFSRAPEQANVLPFPDQATVVQFPQVLPTAAD